MNQKNNFLRIFYLIFCGMGAFFTIFGLASFIFISSSGSLLTETIIIPITFIIIGIIFLITGLVFYTSSQKETKKAGRLKQNGVRYDGNIEDIYYNQRINVNGRNPLIVECSYVDGYGRSYLVKSGNVWLSAKNLRTIKQDNLNSTNLKAFVYVNRDDPKDYFVEVYQSENTKNSQTQFDFDLR